MPHSFFASAAQLIDYYQLNQLFEQSKKIEKQSGAVGGSWSVGAFGAVVVSAPGRRARVKPRTQIPFGKWVCVWGCVGCRRRAPTCATCGAGVHPVGRRGSGGGMRGKKNAPSLRGRGWAHRVMKRDFNLLPTIGMLIFQQSTQFHYRDYLHLFQELHIFSMMFQS